MGVANAKHHPVSDESTPKHHHHHASSDDAPKKRHHLASDDSDDTPKTHHRHHVASDDGDDTPKKHHHHVASDDSSDSTPKRHHHVANSDNNDDTPKPHRRHHSDDADSDDSSPHARRIARLHKQHLEEQAQQEHEKRLAAQEEREHRYRLRHMSHEDRVALRQHDRRLAKIQAHEQRLAEQQLEARLAELQREHDQRIAHLHHKHERTQEAEKPSRGQRLAQTAHDRRVARLEAQHKAHLANLLAEHNARLAKIEAAHQAAVRAHERIAAERALEHSTAVARKLAEHNARLAAQKAHYVAMHGDDTAGKSIFFTQTIAANVPVKVITVDLNNPNVKVSAVMAKQGDGTSEPFRQMIDRSNPNVAVTGTFFSLDNLKPVGDIVIDGSLVHFGGMGTALCVTEENKAAMVSCQWGRHHDWSPYDFVVACGPRLLEHSKIVLDPHAERFKDRHMLAPNSRIAVGITPGNKLVFVMTREPIYLGRLAKVMRGLGCREAMNLDAGTSTGFYYNGTTLAHPGRKLTNMIVVYGSRERYEHALNQLVSPAYHKGQLSADHRQVSRVP